MAEGKIRKLLITVPPGHAKSLMASVLWPAWVWLHRPAWRLISATYVQDLSNRDALKCRDLIASPWYRGLFRPTWKPKFDQNTKSHYKNTATGERMATSVGAGTTGFRADGLIFDDLLSVQHAWSKKKRDTARDWYQQAAYNRVKDPRAAFYVSIQQRLHGDDVAAAMLREGDWVELRLPTEYEPEAACETPIGWRDPRQLPGQLLFPERYPEAVIEAEKKRLGTYGYSAQHQQRPAPPDGGLWKEHWLRRYDTLPPLEELTDWTQSWDLKAKKSAKKSSSWAVGQLWAKRGPDRYLIDQVRGRWGFNDSLRWMRVLCRGLDDKVCKAWRHELWKLARAIIVEEKALGIAVVETLKTELDGIITASPTDDKESRAAAHAPTLEAGNVWVPLNAPWGDELVGEWSTFPHSPYNDQVDCASQALERLREEQEAWSYYGGA